MKNAFFYHIENLIDYKNVKILVAVSGGVDSMVLIDLLNKIDCHFSVAHCNFCLRGPESDSDEQFVSLITQSKNIELFTKRFNTEIYAKNHNISIQMAARQLRYEWFGQLKKEHDFNYIATAHHYDDSVETVILNIIRGTGIAGLHGIQPNKDGLIRPLINFHKKNILQYAAEHDIDYREDSSNINDKYLRNKIRNKIIPLMEEINPSVITSIGEMVVKINSIEKIYREAIEQKKEKLLSFDDNQYIIDIPSLLSETMPQQILYEIMLDFGFLDVDAVFKSLSSESGKEFFSSDFYMVKDRNSLIISKPILTKEMVIESEFSQLEDSLGIALSTKCVKDINIDNSSKKVMYIDYEKLHFPLTIRPWKNGDKFIPLGMNGFKKISDYFIDQKFSLIKKKQTYLMISNNDIVCIIGERLDDRFKLVQNSKKVYIVTI